MYIKVNCDVLLIAVMIVTLHLVNILKLCCLIGKKIFMWIKYKRYLMSKLAGGINNPSRERNDL